MSHVNITLIFVCAFLGWLLGFSYISRKSVRDGGAHVIDPLAWRAPLSLLWLVVHVFPARELNVFP